jgi:hypothetical protein
MKQTFSPITNDERFQAAMEYIVAESVKLAKQVLGRDLPLDTICFFTHSPEEYEFVEQAVKQRGPVSKFSHGPTLYVDSDFTVAGHHIRIFGVRQPDPTRPQLGYGDYPVNDYIHLLQTERDNPYVKEIISGRGQSLVELRHPDFDVLGFIVDEQEHK